MEDVRYELTLEEIQLITENAVRAGIKSFHDEQKKDAKKIERSLDRANNAKKILSGYRRCKAALEGEIIFTKDEEAELRWKFLEDLMGTSPIGSTRIEKRIESENARHMENAYIIKQVDKAIGLYRSEVESSDNEEYKRRFRELCAMYINPEASTAEKIAEAENISVKTIYRDIRIACGIVAQYMA